MADPPKSRFLFCVIYPNFPCLDTDVIIILNILRCRAETPLPRTRLRSRNPQKLNTDVTAVVYSDIETGSPARPSGVKPQPRLRGAPLCLELFAGTGRFTAAVRAMGFDVAASMDIRHASFHDLSRRSTQLRILM